MRREKLAGSGNEIGDDITIVINVSSTDQVRKEKKSEIAREYGK